MIQSILVGIDGSTAARRGLDLALDLATRIEAALRLVHVIDLPTFWHPSAEPHEAAASAAHGGADWARAQLRTLATEEATLVPQAEALCRSRGVPCQAVTIEGWAPRVLSQQLSEMHLGVFGRAGRRQDVIGETTGATAQYLLRRADVPIVLVDRSAPLPRRILLGWDGSPGAQRALVVAAELSRRTGFELQVVHVKAGLDARSPLDSAKKALAGDAAVRVSFEDCTGGAYDVLSERVREKPDTLLVLGGRGHHRLGDLLLGTLTESFHYHSTATLLVAR